MGFFTRKPVYLNISMFWTPMFWTPMFLISFGMAVVAGIVMPFQFGANWSRFSGATANVL